MRITEISVKQLFGVFDHTIPLNTEDRITIIYGLNGLGKTILLQMVQGLFKRRYNKLREIPFQSFEVKFDDESVLKVEKEIKSVSSQQTLFDDMEVEEIEAAKFPEITFKFIKNKEIKSFNLPSSKDFDPRRIPASMVENIIPFLDRVGPQNWLNLQSGEVLSLNEVVDQYGYLLPGWRDNEPQWWVEVQKSMDVHLIEAQRLFHFRQTESRYNRHSEMIQAIQEYSLELAKTIKDNLAEYATLSQRLDRTFPSRLVEQLGRSELTENELRAKLSELETKRAALRDTGLLDQEEEVNFLPQTTIEDSTMDVLAVYVQDVEQKLGILDDLADKIELFTGIINNRISYTSKQMIISKDHGYSIRMKEGGEIPLTALSSGEQHEIVLMYQLLFKVKPDSLILIDEPELSLHVGWQKEFLSDIENITELVSFDILMATHSPQIIHDRWDLTVELKGFNTNERVPNRV